MYLPSCYNFPSKSDFGTITPSPTLLDHSNLSGRRLSDYKGYCYSELWQHPTPNKWALYQSNRSGTPPQPARFSSPGDVVFHRDQAVYAAPTGPSRFPHAQVFTGEPHGCFPGGYTSTSSPDSHMSFPRDARNRVLPSAFDQFFDYAQEGVDLNTDTTLRKQHDKDGHGSEWTSCHGGGNRGGRGAKGGSDTEPLDAVTEDEKDAPLSNGSAGDPEAPSESHFTVF